MGEATLPTLRPHICEATPARADKGSACSSLVARAGRYSQTSFLRRLFNADTDRAKFKDVADRLTAVIQDLQLATQINAQVL